MMLEDGFDSTDIALICRDDHRGCDLVKHGADRQCQITSFATGLRPRSRSCAPIKPDNSGRRLARLFLWLFWRPFWPSEHQRVGQDLGSSD